MPVEVGARRVTELILEALRGPLHFAMRWWGYGIVLLVAVAGLVVDLLGSHHWALTVWCLTYAAYNLLLELARQRAVESYDEPWFQGLRVASNIVAMTALLAISPNARGILWIGYIVPIGSALLYFPRTAVASATLVMSFIGMYAGSILLALPPQYDPVRLTFLGGGLLGLSGGLWLLIERWIQPSPLGDVATRFHMTDDLDTLAREIVRTSASVAQAERVLVLIIDPKTKSYIHHETLSFTFRKGRSVEELCERCAVIRNSEPFEGDDLGTTLYAKFFECQPRSIIAVPIFSKARAVMGVLSVADDRPNRFAPSIRKLLENLSFEAAAAIENALTFRLAQLHEARRGSLEVQFTRAASDADVGQLLLSEAMARVPHVDGVILYRFDGSENVFPWLHSDAVALQQIQAFEEMAGRCAAAKESIMVRDASTRDWPLDRGGLSTGALALAPISDRLEDQPLGVMVVYSSHAGAFNATTEMILAGLSHQAGAALALLRLRRHETLMRRILNELQVLDDDCDEDDLTRRIVDLAARLLPFRGVTLSLIRDGSSQLVVRATTNRQAEASIVRTPVSEAQRQALFEQPRWLDGPYIVQLGDAAWALLSPFGLDHPWIVDEKEQSQYALFVPMLTKGKKVAGVLALGQPTTTVPSPEIVDAAGVLGSAASWILSRAHGRRQISKERARLQRFIGAISEDLAQCRSQQAAGDVAVRIGATLLNTEACTLYRVTNETISLAHSTYLAGTEYIGREKPIRNKPRSGFAAWAAFTGETFVFTNREHEQHPAYAADIDHEKYLPSKSCESLMIVPVRDTAGRMLAVLAFVNKQGTTARVAFSKEDVKNAGILARQVALTMEALDRYESASRWEWSGFQDELHELSNWYHAGIFIPLEVMAHRLENGESGAALDMLPEIVLRSRTALWELRTLLSAARSGYLEERSFRKALERIARAWRLRFRLAEPILIQVTCPENFDAPQLVRNVLLRIVASALANAILHSGVADDPNGNIVVNVCRTSNRVSLRVGDNGRGLNGAPPGYGRTRMRALIDLLNKELKITASLVEHSAPGEGTTVLVDVPLPESA